MAWTRRALVGALLLGVVSACGVAPSGPSAALPTARVIITPAPPSPTASPEPSFPTLTPEPSAPTPTPSPTPAPPSPTPTATATPTPTLDTDAAREAALAAEINRVRAENGMPPYAISPELNATAHAHSCDMAAHMLISHTGSDGRTLRDRLATATPPWQRMSESIAAGFDDPAKVVALWMDEPPDGPHRLNILNPDQREVGTGYCYAADDATGNHYYWTADFALRSE